LRAAQRHSGLLCYRGKGQEQAAKTEGRDMSDLSWINQAARRERATGPWFYRRPATPEIVELAIVQGADVALPIHFHDEDQLTFILSGRRRFHIGGHLTELRCGQGFFITAGTPHSSLPESDGVVCFNAYLRAGTSALPALVEEMARHWAKEARFSPGDLAGMIRAHRQSLVDEVGLARTVSPFDAHGTVRDAAEQACMSREAFSRRFRRTRGVPPSLFRSLTKLNKARLLLRAGLPLAAAAAEAGFADQSHLGRCFRRTFGVTPGAYQAGWERSHWFQTGGWPGF
jgi:AraC-like DNA-binding protein/mannose-6-phosphate isomerase-like protein (cupin superfamily)